ncbi:MAG: hypothetical protein LBH60_06325 [Prevotellaceae bacterium]|jgi:hypothetical protein|nr:hypothetical protein [Prevotellaceae bacterium]
MNAKSVLKDKSFEFAVKFPQFLQKANIYILDKLLKTDVADIVPVYDTEYTQSNANFISKYTATLRKTDLYEILISGCNELISMPVTIVKMLKIKSIILKIIQL